MSQLSEPIEAQTEPGRRMSEWMRRFVETLRLDYASMTEEERRFVYNLDDFSSPCQIDVFWFQHPDSQYVIVTHFDDRPDLEITVNGPFPTHESVDRLENILDESRWNRPVPTGEPRIVLTGGSGTFRDIIEGCFVGIVNNLRGLPFQKPIEKASYGFKSFLAPKAFVWYLRGDVSRENPSEVALEIVKQARDQAAASKTSQPVPPSEPKTTIQGHGSFIFPPVWIGDEPKPTFREKAMGGWYRLPLKMFDGIYKDRLIVANHDGFLVIAEGDRVKATNLLNEIMAVRLLDGKSVFSFRELEVEPAIIDPQTKEISSFGVPSLSPRWYLMEERWKPPYIPAYGKRDVISIDEFKAWIRRANRITQDSELADSMRSLLEAYTHFADSRYLESFVLAWVVVEKHLYTVWKRFLKDEGLSRERRGKLTNPISWSIDYVIESLSLGKQVSSDEYSKLMSMKSLRNDIIHEGEPVSKQQAEQALQTANQIVTQRIDILEARDT